MPPPAMHFKLGSAHIPSCLDATADELRTQHSPRHQDPCSD
jgi:hypothetical protein